MATQIKLKPGRRYQWASKVRTGCLTCRQRRVKCDEAKPQCRRCLVARRECLGHLYGLGEPPNRETGGLLSLSYYTLAKVVELDSSADMLDLCYMLTLLHSSSLPTSRVIDLSLALSTTCWYLDELPCRTGYEPALDSAANCVALVLREYLSSGMLGLNDAALSPASLQSYVMALATLRKALEDPKRFQSAEILCAAQLLDAFEVLIQRRRNAPTRHIRGIYHLIKQRGATQFQTQFELGLLLAQVPNIISQACDNQEAPFLSQNDWMEVIRSCAQPVNQGGVLTEIRVQIYVHNIIASALVHDVSTYLTSMKYTEEHQNALINQITQGQLELKQWRSRWAIRDLLDNCDDETKGPKPRQYTDNMACLSDAYTLLYNRLFISLSDSDIFAAEETSVQLAAKLLEKYPSAKRPREAGILMAVTASMAVLTTAMDYKNTFLQGHKHIDVTEHERILRLSTFNDFLEQLRCPALRPIKKLGNPLE